MPTLKEISILTVHYNTPKLLTDLLDSIDKYYPTIEVYIVDGSDNKEIIQVVKEICLGRKNYHLFSMGKNIHHGPGIDYGIHKIATPYILLVDTDSKIIKGGLIEAMYCELTADFYGIGTIEYVNRDGWNVDREIGIPYLHPRCSLLSKKAYLDYKPAHKHGAPMINAMTDLYDQGQSAKLKYFDKMDDYYVHTGRGTVNLTGGYHLESVNVKQRNFFVRVKSKIKRLLDLNR